MDDQAGEPADLRGVEIISAHEHFDAAQTFFALVAQRAADVLLMFEGQLILMSAGGEVQLVAHPEQKVLGLFELGDVGGVDDAVEREAVQILRLELGAGDPLGGLNVAQTTLPFLDLRFEQIDRAAVAPVAQPAFVKLLAHESADALFEQFGLDDFLEFAVERKIAAQKSRVEQRRADFHVLLAQAHAIGDGARGVSHLQAAIEQSVEQFFGQRLDEWRHFAGMQDEQIDVGARVELAAPVAALGGDGEARCLAGKRVQEIGADGAQELANQMIHDGGISRRHFQSAGALTVPFE